MVIQAMSSSSVTGNVNVNDITTESLDVFMLPQLQLGIAKKV